MANKQIKDFLQVVTAAAADKLITQQDADNIMRYMTVAQAVGAVTIASDKVDDYSANATQMQTSNSPGDVGTESLATTIRGELERLRSVLIRIQGTDHWYRQTNLMVREEMFH